MMEGTLTLYRSVGAEELELISRGGFAAFPPRLREQKALYAVATEPARPTSGSTRGFHATGPRIENGSVPRPPRHERLLLTGNQVLDLVRSETDAAKFNRAGAWLF
jgi:hypothetical protein